MVSCRDQIREDYWVLVRSDKVPSQEELSEEASGGRYCYIM